LIDHSSSTSQTVREELIGMKALSTALLGPLAVGLLLQGCVATEPRAGLDTQPAASLVVVGSNKVIEIAPVVLAVRDIQPEGPPVQNGFVANLVADVAPADVAGNSETQLLRHSVARPDLRIIMTVVEGKYRIIARRSAGINSLADLKGKRIATSQLTSAHYFLQKMLATADVDEADVTIVPLQAFQRIDEGILSGDFEALAIWEPFSETAIRLLGDDGIEFSGEGLYTEHYNLNTTAAVLADPVKRERVVSLLRAVIRSTAEMKRDPIEAQSYIARAGDYPFEEVAQSWAHHDFYAGFAPDMLDLLEDQEIWLARHEKRRPRTREQLAGLIDRSVYEEALRGMDTRVDQP
jgi:NitT/TauT family transport system substrate-binding protein